MTVNIKVTERHIALGKPTLERSCPIAVALQEIGFVDVVVGLSTVYCDDKVGTLPIEAIRFIYNFDHGKDVAPFDFDLYFTGRAGVRWSNTVE